MNAWTRKPPTRPGWYWRVMRDEMPKPVAVSREDSPDYVEPIISAVGPDIDCERIHDAQDDVLWSSKPFAPPPVPKWPGVRASAPGEGR